MLQRRLAQQTVARDLLQMAIHCCVHDISQIGIRFEMLNIENAPCGKVIDQLDPMFRFQEQLK